MDADEALGAVEADLGADLRDPARQASSSATHVFLAGLDDRRVAVKIAATGEGVDRVRREAAVLDHIDGRTPVPTPPPVAAGTLGRGQETPYLVSEVCDGRDVGDLYERLGTPGRRRLLSRLGRSVARLHDAVPLDRHGRLVAAADGGVRVEPRPWPTYLREDLLEPWLDELSGTRFDHLARRAADRLGAVLDELGDPPEPTLLHTDIGPWNLFVRDWGTEPDPEAPFTCLFDWDRAVAGPAEFGAFRAAYRLPLDPKTIDGRLPDETDALYDAYRSERGLPDGFGRRRRIYRLLLEIDGLTAFGSLAAAASAQETAVEDRLRSRVQGALDAVG